MKWKCCIVNPQRMLLTFELFLPFSCNTNPVWLESCTPIRQCKNVKELNKSPLFFSFNVCL